MVDTVATTEKPWYGIWADITLRFNLRRYEIEQMNLVANRGLPKERTDYGQDE